jgi:hypothetical protein
MPGEKAAQAAAPRRIPWFMSGLARPGCPEVAVCRLVPWPEFDRLEPLLRDLHFDHRPSSCFLKTGAQNDGASWRARIGHRRGRQNHHRQATRELDEPDLRCFEEVSYEASAAWLLGSKLDFGEA